MPVPPQSLPSCHPRHGQPAGLLLVSVTCTTLPHIDFLQAKRSHLIHPSPLSPPKPPVPSAQSFTKHIELSGAVVQEATLGRCEP